ncbi:MAG: GT4 family glycosyltransferase PelF [Candidatus Omnitrophota bacterium]|nr:GT4 family glycosyltransferase PelF [Candidatus Omnitrophota bacterium]
MKILQILPALHVGGVETGTVDFSKYLIAHGHQAMVVSSGGELVKELENIGVKHYTLPVNEKSLFTIFKMIGKLADIIKKEGIEIVHARSRVPAWIAFFACKKTRTAFITTCHGHYTRHFLSRVMAWPKLVICPSNVIGGHMIENFGLPHERVRLIPRSVDLERFTYLSPGERNRQEFVVGIIGRITPLKGHAYFLKAMAKVVRQIPFTKIWIIGDAPVDKQSYRDELVTLARRLGLSSYVEFLGNRKDIPELLSRMNCLVLSTITEEAFGRVILEAQAAGVPVVATRVGGVVDIIDENESGLLVTPKEPEEIANAVIKILKDLNLTQKLAQNGRKKVEQQFTLKQMAERTLRVYEELLTLQNILVIKVGAIGDVILATASLRAIRNNFPAARIFCLVGKDSRQILQRCPYLTGMIIYDYQDNDKGYKGALNIARELRRYNFDKVIDFQNNRKSHLISFLSMAAERYGYDNKKWGILLNHKIKEGPLPLPAVDHQFRVLEMLDIKPEDKYLELWPGEEDKDYIKELFDTEWLSEVENIVGINLAASERWLTTCWPIEKIARLCDEIANRNMRAVITGTEKEADLARELLQLVKSKPAIFVGKTTIMQLACLIKRCKVYISGDSAPLHVAAAMKVAVIGLFGPTSALRHMPPAEKFAVIKGKVDCAPCYKPNCRNIKCMQAITVEEVLETIERFIQ